MKKTMIFCLLATFCLNFSPPAHAADFKQAVGSYKAGDFKKALPELEACDKQFPGNTLIKYYLAMTHQQLGHIPQAKANYLWVAKNGDMNFRERAQKGCDQLSGLSSSRSSSSSQTANSQTSGAGEKQKEIAKKCLYFTASWCGPCKAFSPVFDATKSKFRNIRFDKYDIDEPSVQSLKKRYNINSVPRIVLLDKGENVIYNGGASPSQFEKLLNFYQ